MAEIIKSTKGNTKSNLKLESGKKPTIPAIRVVKIPEKTSALFAFESSSFVLFRSSSWHLRITS